MDWGTGQDILITVVKSYDLNDGVFHWGGAGRSLAKNHSSEKLGFGGHRPAAPQT